MSLKFSARSLAAIVASLAVVAAEPAAAAATCFTWSNGSVHLQFAGSITRLGYHTLTGVTFGALSSCAGLTHWGVMGAAYTESTSIVMGFRAETVDASSCGAVDFIVNLSPSTLSGPLQLFNERTNFGNTGTLVSSTCVAVPPAEAHSARKSGTDTEGN